MRVGTNPSPVAAALPLVAPDADLSRQTQKEKKNMPVADARRIEVVANGLLLWHGS